MNNKDVYSLSKIVAEYSKKKYLIPAEKIIFKKIEKRFLESHVIDLGVGGGRTTHAIAHFCKTYIGIDYSPTMVKSCQWQYPQYTFLCQEASNLALIPNGSKDIAIFSFNGIDCVDLEERIKITKEIYQKLTNEGIFIFSFHNANALDKLYTYQYPKNPLNWLNELKRIRKLNLLNGPKTKYKGLDFFKIQDGAENFESEILYIKPILQKDILSNNGFKIIEAYEADTGKLLKTNLEFEVSKSFWIYLVCKKI